MRKSRLLLRLDLEEVGFNMSGSGLLLARSGWFAFVSENTFQDGKKFGL